MKSDFQTRDDIAGGMAGGFTRYTKANFQKLTRQLNIMVFIGNGFDLQLLNTYKRPIDTRYESFYHYLNLKNYNSNNFIYKTMKEECAKAEAEGYSSNWSDIEHIISVLVDEGILNASEISEQVKKIQYEFAGFLELIVTSELLHQIGDDAAQHKLSLRSLTEFLYDIADEEDFKAMDFPESIGHYNLYNYLFVNFNYTPLLDNFIYLDQIQFDPLMHRTVDTNIAFKKDPRGFSDPRLKVDRGYSGYVTTSVIHPHGFLSIPRSLLFGIDSEDGYKHSRTPTRHLEKPYWSQAETLYTDYFGQADLFIIFGSSIGMSDGWWWRNIARSLSLEKNQILYNDDGSIKSHLSERSELIIYQRQDLNNAITKEKVKDRFFQSASVSEDCIDKISKRIHVVLYDDNADRVFLADSLFNR